MPINFTQLINDRHISFYDVIRVVGNPCARKIVASLLINTTNK